MNKSNYTKKCLSIKMELGYIKLALPYLMSKSKCIFTYIAVRIH